MTEIMRVHKLTRNRHMSTWYVKTPRRRKIRLQDYKGRLYLVGKLYSGIVELLPYECSLAGIIKRFGKPLPGKWKD